MYTFSLTWTTEFSKPEFTDNWDPIVLRSVMVIPTEDMLYRGWVDQAELTLKAGTPLILNDLAGTGFPLEIKGWGTLSVLIK